MKTDWMAEGLREFQAGNIDAAIRAFEYEILRAGAATNDDSGASAAWRMLGRCHAEHDMDGRAIPCLEQAVDRDPYSAPARLALGVSHVNELNHIAALHHLKAWITHNPKFAGLDTGEDVYGSTGGGVGGREGATGAVSTSAEAAFEEVQRLLLSALQFQSATGSEQDTADILEALGVVYNVSRDYDAAVDVFQKACDLRPDDYQLWNKLGATLANSNRSDQALSAYHRALQLKPKYARAWLNMAISYSNLQQYDEAARCYLQTLSLNPAALHCWSYLRIALSCAEKWDLIPATAARDLSAFRPHFDFTEYTNGGTVP
jgi:peroxin-5